jgi:hypothetical protein
MSLLFGNPINIVINAVCILRLYNIYVLPICLVMLLLICIFVCVCVIYIFVSMRFKPTNSYVAKLFIVHGGKGGLNSFLPVLSPS